MGTAGAMGSQLPAYGNTLALEPVAILAKRMVKRGNQPITQMLVHWTNSFPKDATWEFLFDL